MVSSFEDDTHGVDCRPRLRDGDIAYLLDSGSMCGVWPASEYDTIDKTIKLQTVDGSPFDCYGTKTIDVKIGRKSYKYKVVVAKVKAPILGWDFIRKYKLDLVWGEFGDIFLRDKTAKIQKRLEHIKVPHGFSPRFEAAEVDAVKSLDTQTEFFLFGQKCVEAIKVEAEKEEHPQKYMKLLQKYKDILKPNFKEAKTKHGIEHAIVTSGPPCKAKTRPLLPGSIKQ